MRRDRNISFVKFYHLHIRDILYHVMYSAIISPGLGLIVRKRTLSAPKFHTKLSDPFLHFGDRAFSREGSIGTKHLCCDDAE